MPEEMNEWATYRLNSQSEPRFQINKKMNESKLSNNIEKTPPPSGGPLQLRLYIDAAFRDA